MRELTEIIQEAFNHGTSNFLEALAKQCEQFAKEQRGLGTNQRDWNALASDIRTAFDRFKRA